MYLLVFVFLVTSLMGLYVETFSMQAARIFASQSSMAQNMLIWHNAAYRTAIFSFDPNTFVDCELTTGRIGSACPTQVQTNAVPATTYYLPAGFNPTYTFTSYAYSNVSGSTTRRFVITYISPPGGDTAAPLVAAGDNVNPVLGYSVNEVYRQMKTMKTPAISYGMVINGVFVSMDAIVDQTSNTLIPITFPLPTSLAISNGSVGYLSMI